MDVTVALAPTGAVPRRTGPAVASTWSAKFLFEDHVVCMTAKQHLDKGRLALRTQKLARIRAILTTAPVNDPGAAGETAEPTADPADRPLPARGMVARASGPLPALPTDAAARSDL